MRKTYTPVKQADGSFLIEGVEIFKLGESKGRNFDQEWFARAQSKHNRFKTESEYLPSVMIGHNGWLQEHEKPEIACFDNLRLAADNLTVLCDYLVEDPNVFSLFNQFPHRSVEIFPDEAHFSRVAHLGGSEPYFKLKPLKVAVPDLYESAEEPELFPFDDGPEPLQFNAEDPAPLPAPLPTDPPELEFYKAERDAALQKQLELQAELDNFRAQARQLQLEQELKSLQDRRKTFQNLGLANPVLDSYFGLRKALLFADNSLNCPVKVMFADSSETELPFGQAFDEFEQLLFHHLTNHTLIANFGQPLPISEAEPQLHAEVESDLDRQRREVQSIKDYFAQQNKATWSNEEYRKARQDLGLL